MDTSNNTHWVTEGILNTFKSDLHPAIEGSLFRDINRFKELNGKVDDTEPLNKSLDDYKFDTPSVTKDYQVISASNYFTNAQQWIGYVTEITKNGFQSQLYDVNDPTTYEIAEFDFKDVPDDDHELISRGAKFYWSLGYEVSRGTRERAFSLRFQRIVQWSNSDYDTAIDRADDLFNNLNWGSE